MTFQDEIKSLALRIAKHVRNEEHLQDINTIFDKFNHELEELEEASEKWDELPDILYYATCAAIQGSPHLLRTMPHRMKTYGVTMEQAQTACLAKYHYRAAGNPKNIEVERRLINEALQSLASMKTE